MSLCSCSICFSISNLVVSFYDSISKFFTETLNNITNQQGTNHSVKNNNKRKREKEVEDINESDKEDLSIIDDGKREGSCREEKKFSRTRDLGIDDNRKKKNERNEVEMDVIVISKLGIDDDDDEREKKNQIDRREKNYKENSQRKGIRNEGNICYLNSTLQALKNSLDFSVTCGEFGEVLKSFYIGNVSSLVSYLEKRLSSNLKRQSDASDYFDRICKLLDKDDSSTPLLNKIKIRNCIVEWTCTNCDVKTIDDRGMKTVAFSLLLDQYDTTLKACLEKALFYKRERTCKSCNGYCYHTAIKKFEVDHLVLVVAQPYSAKIYPLLHFELNENIYELISVILHSGSERSGHYIAAVRDENSKSGEWNICNDNMVKRDNVKHYLEDWTTTLMIYNVTKKKQSGSKRKGKRNLQ